ncbi:MAG: hypothetical protein AMXMBFR82_34280 [Candidatus Hydrogenedentota bacterium]
MRRIVTFASIGTVLTLAALFALLRSIPAASAQADSASNADQIRRGEYLTHSVAMCVVCHSPKDEHGQPILSQQFEGGVIPAKATYPKMATWASHAPALGPLAGGTGDDVITLLKTGIVPRTGKPPRGPMPPFRLSDEDARAVVACLQSLGN